MITGARIRRETRRIFADPGLVLLEESLPATAIELCTEASVPRALGGFALDAVNSVLSNTAQSTFQRRTRLLKRNRNEFGYEKRRQRLCDRRGGDHLIRQPLQTPASSLRGRAQHSYAVRRIRLLTWGQVDLAAATLRIGKSKPSNGTGRIIPLDSKALQALQMLTDQVPVSCSGGSRKLDYVFANQVTVDIDSDTPVPHLLLEISAKGKIVVAL